MPLTAEAIAAIGRALSNHNTTQLMENGLLAGWHVTRRYEQYQWITTK